MIFIKKKNYTLLHSVIYNMLLIHIFVWLVWHLQIRFIFCDTTRELDNIKELAVQKKKNINGLEFGINGLTCLTRL